MRVRTRTSTPKNGLRWIETLFLIVGLVAVDCYIWVNADSVVYQVYQDWKFEQTLHGQSTALGKFVVDESGLRRVFGFGVNPELEPPQQSAGSGPVIQPQHSVDEVIGRLEIPRLNIRAIVREGDGEGTLRHAVGHVPSTALPGQMGNVALAAHRDTFFRPLRNVRKNDRIIVSTLNGTYEYLVQTTQIVNPDDVSVLKTSASKELTLVTCYPFYYIGSAPHRFIVHATQVAATPQPPPQQPIGS